MEAVGGAGDDYAGKFPGACGVLAKEINHRRGRTVEKVILTTKSYEQGWRNGSYSSPSSLRIMPWKRVLHCTRRV